jgi:hypothetical protein
MTNLAIRNSSRRASSAAIIKLAIEAAINEDIVNNFNIPGKNKTNGIVPCNSVLYLGQLNLMLGCYRRISKDSCFNKLNDSISQWLFTEYSHSSCLNLESYLGNIWIPDNSVAIASLKLHSFNTNSGYDKLCNEWVARMRTKYTSPKTKVLYSTINASNGNPEEEPRGSMLGWSIMFIYQIDSTFSKELYTNYKQNFSTNLISLRLFKERHNDFSINSGDIDSGPLLLGYSIPANEFALAGAICHKDYKTALKLERLIKLGTHKIIENDMMHYSVRFIDFNISPLAEAMVLNSMTIVNWTNTQ